MTSLCSSIQGLRLPATEDFRFQTKQNRSVIIHTTHRRSIHVLAKASSSKRTVGHAVIMVDPLEAKQLAKKQMEEIRAKKRFKTQRRIEAVNGAWAMIGLTAGLVIEGLTGDTIHTQLIGYWSAITSYFGI